MTPRRSDLLRLLAAYRPSDPDERSYRVEMLDLAAVAPDPFDRHHYQPGHFTTSGFVLHPDGQRVLLIDHAKIGKWLQPGGHVERGDRDLLAAARREIAEETSVTALTPVTEAIVDIDIHRFPRLSDQPAHRHFDVRFAFVAAEDALETNDEAAAARWVAASELATLGADRSVIRPIQKLVGR